MRSIILPYFLMQLKRLILLRYFITIFYSAASCLNSFNNSLLYSGRIDISLTFSEFLSIACFGFTVFSTILLPYKFLKIPINDLWTNFLEAAFWASNPVSNNCFYYLLEKLLSDDKSPYSLIYIYIGSIEYRVISIY